MAKRKLFRRIGLRLLRSYAEDIKSEHPELNEGQLENMIQLAIEEDFADKPVLRFLIELLKEFLPFIIAGLFDHD